MPLHRSLRRRSVFTIFTTIEEHCLPEDSQAVALEILAVTKHYFGSAVVLGAASLLTSFVRRDLSRDALFAWIRCFAADWSIRLIASCKTDFASSALADPETAAATVVRTFLTDVRRADRSCRFFTRRRSILRRARLALSVFGIESGPPRIVYPQRFKVTPLALRLREGWRTILSEHRSCQCCHGLIPLKTFVTCRPVLSTARSRSRRCQWPSVIDEQS